MNNSNIEWTDKTWNPVTGCTKVSAGCKNCYAESIFNRFEKQWGKFVDIKCHEDRLNQPSKIKKPIRIFVNSMSDLFHKDVPFAFIDKVMKVIEDNPQHTFQVLTKRPERALEYFERHYWKVMPSPINLWLGVSVENQMVADLRIPILAQFPCIQLKFLSVEPLLENIDLERYLISFNHLGEPICYRNPKPFDWVIVGGESGNNARPLLPEWVRSIRYQCQEADVPFFFKQWGEWKEVAFYDDLHDFKNLHRFDSDGLPTFMAKVGKKHSGSLLDGREYKEFPV